MKKFLLMLLGALLALPSLARDFTYTYEGQTLTYTVIDEDAKTCRTKAGMYNGLLGNNSAGNEVSGNLVIPSIAKDSDIDYTVTALGFMAFYDCSGLTSVVIPNSVKVIGISAFERCSELTSVTIPNSVNTIEHDAFFGCSGLTSVTIPNSVIEIGSYAFARCSGLTTLTIPNSVIEIGGYAFASCSGLTTLTIPNSVIEIGGYAFSNCSGLTTLTIPNSVTIIGENAFFGCSNLAEIKVDGANKQFSANNGVLFNKEQSVIICYPPKKANESYEIPNTVTEIGYFAFGSCSSLTSLIIPDSVTKIGSWAFDRCSGLTILTIPNSVIEIGSYAFANCSGLTTLTIPSSVTIIGQDVFCNCSDLAEIKVDGANKQFSANNGVLFNKEQSVIISYPPKKEGGKYEIPNTVTKILKRAFWYCSNLTSLTIPSSVTEIEQSAIEHCLNMEEINVDSSNKHFCASNGVLFNQEQTIILYYPPQKANESYEIPNTVTEIGYDAFKNCKRLISLTIPGSVCGIMEHAFSGCSSLSEIYTYNTNNIFDLSAFDDETYSTATLYVNRNDFEKAKTTMPWEHFSQIKPMMDESERLFDKLIFKFINSDDGKSQMEVSGNILTEDTNVIIPPSVRENNIDYTVVGISAKAFNGCKYLTNLTIPTSITTIGDSTFLDCTNLTSVEIPTSVTSIGNHAFRRCTNLTSVEIPTSVTSIGDYAFYSCKGLINIEIPNSIAEIGTSSFSFCSGLSALTLPNSVRKIGGWAFSGCSGLTTLTIPNSVTEIGKNAFYNCSALTTLLIPNYVTKIGANAFSNCSGLTALIVGKNVRDFGVDSNYKRFENSVFEKCTSLKKGAYPKDLNRIFEKSGASSLFTFAYDPELYIVDGGLIMHQDETKMILDFAIADGHYSVPDSITAIGDKAFANCDSLSSIIISPYVTEVGEDIFMGCDNLLKGAYPDAVENPFGEDVLAICFDAYDSVVENDFVYSRRKNALYFAPLDIESSFTVPETVTEITDNAFGLCSTLESIVLPEGLTKLGTKVWDGCPDIMHVVCKSAEPAAATRDLFQVGVYDNATLYVPKGSRAKYESAVPWKYFYNITEDEFNGIEEVEAESGTIREESGAEIFNLNGVRVAADCTDGLPAGIYIVRQGAKTEKIVVR